MRNKKILAGWALIVLITLACGISDKVSGIVKGGETNKVETLWSDVPKISGLTPSDSELPLPAKLAIQTLIKNSSQGQGSVDFIAFKSSKSVSELTDFYSINAMQEQGWNMKDQSGCTGDQTGSGAVCFFGKENEDKTGSFLVIFAAEDSKTKQTTVFFMRVDVKDMPTKTP